MSDEGEASRSGFFKGPLGKFGLIGIAGALSFLVAHVYVVLTWEGSYVPWFLNSQHGTVVTEMWLLFTSTICMAVSGSRTVIPAICFFIGVFVAIIGCLLAAGGPGTLGPIVPAYSMIILTPAVGFGALIGHGVKMLVRFNEKT